MGQVWEGLRRWARRRGGLLGALGYLLLIALVPFFYLGLRQIEVWLGSAG